MEKIKQVTGSLKTWHLFYETGKYGPYISLHYKSERFPICYNLNFKAKFAPNSIELSNKGSKLQVENRIGDQL